MNALLFTLLAASCVVALLWAPAHAQKVCPACMCPAQYEPVCAINTMTRRYRGFSSQCLLDCTNVCRGGRFKLHSHGRCGKDKIQQRPPSSTEPATLHQ